jgi:drug/metabolite transporter (DMT)-like permease
MIAQYVLHLYSDNRYVIHVLSGAFLISFSAVWVKLAEVPPATSGLYRVFFGFLILFLITFWKRELHQISGSKLGLIIFCGLAFGLDLLFWHQSILFIGPGLATIISNFQVFLLALYGIVFLKEKIRLCFLLSIPTAFLGLFLVVGMNWNTLSGNYKTGVFFGLLTALCYVAFLISLRKIQQNNSSSSFFYTLMLISFFSTICMGLEMRTRGESFIIPDSRNLFFLLMLALFSQVVGWVLITNAISRIPTSLTGFILLLQPALSFLWDVFFFSRPTDLLNWLGIIITLSAIYMGVQRPRDTIPLHSSRKSLLLPDRKTEQYR